MRLLSAVCLVLALALPSRSDEIHLKNGGTVVGTVIDDGDPVVVKTVGGGTIKIGRDKIDSIEKKPVPQPVTPDSKPRERKAVPSPRFTDLLNGYSLRPPPGWKKIGTSKNSKITFGAPDTAGPFKMDVWIIKTDGDLAALWEKYTKSYREAFKGYESKFEKGGLLGKMPAKEFAGTFQNDLGEKLAHAHMMGGEKGLFFLVFFQGSAEKFDANLPAFEECFASFETMPKPEISDADLKKFMEAFQHGVELVHDGKDADAVAQFDICAELLPKHADTHQNLAVLTAKLGNTKRAIEEYTTLAKLRADDPQPLYDLGTILFKNNRFPDALASFEKAIELNPDYVEAWINVGAVHSQLAAYDKAVAAFRTAIEIDPKAVPAWFNMGQVEHIRNNYEAAKEAFNAVLKIDKTHEGALAELKKIKQEGH